MDRHGIALKFVVTLIVPLALAAVKCPFIFAYGMRKHPGWGLVESGGSHLLSSIGWLQRSGVLRC